MDSPPIKRCRVCGDTASGFNYSGLSCESCKVFFLRNSHRKFTCPKEGNCLIDQYSRKICQKCRLVKCLAIGMTKGVSKAPKNRIQQAVPVITKHDSSFTNAHAHSLQSILQDSDETAQKLAQVEPTSKECDPKSPTTRFILSPAESALIREIESALAIFPDELSLPLVGKLTRIIQSVNWPTVYARRIVKFCKNIPTFKALPQADQLQILKFFYMPMVMIRLIFMFSEEANGYPALANEAGKECIFMDFSLASQMQSQEFARSSREIVERLHDEMENDETIRNCLIAITLFTPVPLISSQEFIMYQYALYRRLLRRYLECKYESRLKARRKYQRLMVALNNLLNMRKDAENFLKEEIEQKDMEQVMLEVMELG